MQLRMLRPNLENLPTIEIPNDYKLRTYQEGDDAHWAKIINASFGSNRTAKDTHNEIIDCPQFSPDGLFFITQDNQPIGTACAWKKDANETEIGYLHMVGVKPNHSGHRLGKWVSLAVIHYFCDRSFKCVILETDDFRLPAVKTYLNLDFVPVFVDTDHPERWKNLFQKLKLSALPDQTNSIRSELSDSMLKRIYA